MLISTVQHVTPPTDSPPLKIMIIGDSISHGREGDFTWRYRLFEWLSSSSSSSSSGSSKPAASFQFVGPYTGTVPPDETRPPQPPPLVNEPPPPQPPLLTNGGYAKAASPEFLSNCNHFAASGRQIYQAKSLVAEQVSRYQPDLCLVQLGFNDLAWLGSSAEGALENMKTLIREARSASASAAAATAAVGTITSAGQKKKKKDLWFAIADVPHRTMVPGREDLRRTTDEYNDMLKRAVKEWEEEFRQEGGDGPSTKVRLVRMCEEYDCERGTYDGLHPNARGEYQIASAFSKTLVDDFGLGEEVLRIPETVGERKLDVPRGIKAETAPCGVEVSWEKVYGAYGYVIERVREGELTRYVTAQYGNKFYENDCVDGGVYRYKVRAIWGDGATRSGWTEIVEAVARPETAPPPRNIRVWAQENGFEIEFDRPEERFAGDIDRYGVVVYDYSVPGNWPCVYGIKGEKGDIPGLLNGHRYGISVRTWNKAGEGLPNRFEREVVVGRVGNVDVPKGLRAVLLASGAVELTWPVDYNVGGYEVWGLNKAEGRQQCLFKCPVDGYQCGRRTVNWLPPSLGAWQFAIMAYNGSQESKLCEWVSIPGQGTPSRNHLSLGAEALIDIKISHS